MNHEGSEPPLNRHAVFSRNLHVALDHAKVPAGKGRATYLARELGITPEACRLWLTGQSVPHGARLADVAMRLDVCIEWLMTGRGPMRPNENRVAEPMADYYTLDERELVQRFRQMVADKQGAVMRLIRTM